MSTILEFYDYIWNRHEKCIQISTNMPGIGLGICEIAVEVSQFSENKIKNVHGKPIMTTC